MDEHVLQLMGKIILYSSAEEGIRESVRDSHVSVPWSYAELSCDTQSS